jgi:hypothetical protein
MAAYGGTRMRTSLHQAIAPVQVTASLQTLAARPVMAESNPGVFQRCASQSVLARGATEVVTPRAARCAPSRPAGRSCRA